MKRQKKLVGRRLLALLLTLTMLLGMVPVTAFGATEIPSGAPFTTVTTNSGDDAVIRDLGKVSGGDLESNGFGELPHYHLEVPSDVESVTITFPGELDRWTMTAAMNDGSITVGWKSSATIEGSSITIPVADYTAIVGENGWESGIGVMPEVGYSPIVLFTFEYETTESEEPEEPSLVDVTLPNGKLGPAINIVQAGSTGYYNGWDPTEYGPVGIYKIQIPTGTETVIFKFSEDADINYVSDQNGALTGKVYYGILTYYEEVENVYLPGYVGKTKTTSISGERTIELDVKSLIQNNQMFGTLNSDFNYIYAIEFEYIASSGDHDCIWNSGEVTKEANCKEAGEKTYTCTVDECGKTKIETIPISTEHSWNSGTVTKESTCVTKGTKSFKCTVNGCDATKTEDIPLAEHTWDAGKVTKEATCKENGTREFQCVVDGCDEVKEESIAKLTTHTYGESGKDETCSICGVNNPDWVDPNMPDVDESGVYQIGTAEELLAFAKYVNKGNTKLNAVLTDDVDLTGKTWTPMVNFGGTFDGQKHTITFDKAPNGLFASTASTFHDDSKGKYFAPYVEISNLIIEGTIEGNQKVGAIVGSACGTKITNCINRANISTTGNYAGGLVGYADYKFRGISYAYVNFLQCGNEGDIQGNNYVGGFIGYTMGGTTLERCYNDGTISGNTWIGGLAGYMRSYAPACSLSNSYNWGGISGSASTGGLVGEMSNTVSVTNCYNAGVVEYALAGSNASGISGFYYLSDASTNVAKNTVEATKMSADDMKSAEFVTTLGDYFRKGSTYPILSWQAAGDAEEYTVTVSRNEGITFNGANIAYSNEAYQFTITINPRYQATNEFKILVNSNAIDYSETDGVYSCTVEEVNGNLTIAVQGVKATKTIVYQGTGLPVSYGYVSEIAVDDVDVKSVRTDGTTIYVSLDGDTELDADVYFTVVKAGDASTILGVSPGTSFTKSLSFGGLTQTIAATMPNSGTSEWTVVVSVDGIVSHSVILPAGEGYVVNGNAAVIDGQDYTFTVEVDKKYTGDTMVVKVGDTTLTPDENGIYTVKNVKDDIEITITGVTKKPFESPLERIEIGDNVLDEEKIVLKTDDFHLGGKGETFDYRVYEEVPYYHVTVPKGTEWVEVIFKAITNILVDSREDKSNVSYGYTTDISNIDAVTSPTIRGTSFEYTKNADGTQSVKIPVTDYTVSETGGKAIGPESSEELQNRPVALFSFLYEKELFAVTLPEAETYTIIPESGYTTSVVEGKDFKFTVRTTPGYVKGQEFAVTADEETLTPDENGVYTIETILDDVKIAVTGVEERDPVSVYLSISHDDQYMVGDKTGKVMALQKVDVPWFDLESYGLERYNYTDNYGTPSVLHLYIYATELFYCGLDAEEAGRGYLYEQGLIDNPDKTKSLLTIDGNPGSLYLKRFWTYDENLNYYSNYVFPTYAGTTIGATADRMALKENDVISLGHFSFWEAYQDPASIFNYFQDGNGSLREVIGTGGDEVSLSVKRAAGDLFAGTSWTNAVEEEVDIYYTKLSELNSGDVTTWTKLGTTDKNGQIQFILTGNIGEPGQYIVAMAGRYGTGTGNTEKICSAPGSILLTVEEKAEDEEVNAVIELIRRIGTVTLDSGETIEIARKAYDALTESQQKEVTNYDALTAAEERYGKMTADKAVADVVVELIGNIGEVTLDKKASIEDARAKYTALTEDQKALVGNYSELISAERSLALLERNPIFEDAYQETKTYFESLDAPTVGSTDGEWRVIGLARSGADVSDEYYRNVVSYVRSEIDGETNRLDHNKSTENSRVILALTALGKDVTNVGGYDLLAGLNDMNYIGKQGINGTIWALIALDSANYETPEGDVTREKLVEAILKAQKSDGSWTMNSDSYGLDMTGMALQALAGYYETNDVVKTAVDKALTGLSALQTQNGMFGSETSTTSESLAQIVVALTALGIDPDTDPRFIKEGGVSVLDAMLTFYKGEGRFEHGLTLGDNVMATEQCFYAMTAYNRFLEGKTSLYKMSDVEKDDSETPIVPVETVTLSSSTLDVSVGKTAVLTATVSPAEATDHLVEWSSSDETVARVSKTGMVTGVGEGVAEIVASCGGVSASCIVTVTKQETGGTVTEPELEFGLGSDEILGYVYVSFEDYGVRKNEELDEMESQFRKPLGMIVSKTKVPYKKNDTIASVTLRLLDYMGIGAEYEGTEYRGFYLESIEDFAVKGVKYKYLGEFDAGYDSGWMITWDDWFINKGASEFTVKNGDYVRWQYTCQLGADIGGDFFTRDETSSSSKPVEENKTSSTITPEASTNSKGEASVEIKKDELTSAVEEATKDNTAGTVVIAPEIKGDASKVTVELPKEAVDSMATSGKTDLTVKTDIATVTLPAETLKELPTEGKTVSVAVETVKGDETAEAGSTAAADKIVVEVAVDNKAVDKIGSGVVASIPAKEVSATSVLVIVDAEGNETIVKKSAVADGEITALLEGSCTVVVKDNKKEFTDTEGHWGKSAAEFASSRELFNGVGNGQFGMNTTMNRAMMATVFYNLENGPEHDGEHDFHDVDENRYYAKPVAWAAESGVLSGYSDGSFRADAPVTREQLAVMLWNYSGKPSGIKALDHSDAGNISSYAKEAMQWAVENGVMSGRANGQLDPKGAATRAEVAQMFKNYIEKVVL